MPQATFSLSWDAYKNNLSSGLSVLQQNGEFVDMTLAADGHFVKVHQIIIALASPYIKEIISSTQCTHPVLFLNKVSYTTLSLVLEYIYTGEVTVEMDKLSDFLEATRELRIKGLEDMTLQDTVAAHSKLLKNEPIVADITDSVDSEICFEITEQDSFDDTHSISKNDSMECSERGEEYREIEYLEKNNTEDTSRETVVKKYGRKRRRSDSPDPVPTKSVAQNAAVMQYTVSNQGSLQMILNRFMYYLKHTNQNNSRQWRCVDYVTNLKCPAYVVTKNEIVLHRISAHNHRYHDAKILKKVRRGAIFAAVQDAERVGTILTQNRLQQLNENNKQLKKNNKQQKRIERNNSESKESEETSLELCNVTTSDCE